jgi:hypothetical protein
VLVRSYAGCGLAVLALLTACAAGQPSSADEQPASEVAAGGLSSLEAVAACAEHLFRGTVLGTAVSAEGLRVTFRVDDWISPSSGGSRVTLVGDDPARQVGAPRWARGQRVVVVDGRDAPLDRVTGPDGEALVAAAERARRRGAICPDRF